MASITEAIIVGKLERQAGELETSLRMSGQIMESLPISLGDTNLSREVFADGSRGDVRVSTQEVQGFLGNTVVYATYQLIDGQLMTRPNFGEGDPMPVKGLKKIKTLAKIAFGKVDHWDRESDFYGTYEEEE